MQTNPTKNKDCNDEVEKNQYRCEKCCLRAWRAFGHRSPLNGVASNEIAAPP